MKILAVGVLICDFFFRAETAACYNGLDHLTRVMQTCVIEVLILDFNER